MPGPPWRVLGGERVTATAEETVRAWFASLEEIPELYLVGGAVRDPLLGRKPKDVDLVCPRARLWAERLAAARDAALVSFDKDPRAACYRLVNRDDPKDVIDLSVLRGAGIEDDLALRDFTVNAMAVRMHAGGALGELVDPTGGRQDLETGVVRMVAPSAFAEDPLRMVRAFRLAGELGFVVAPETLSAVGRQARLLRGTAGERVRDELMRILGLDHSLPLLRSMDRSALLEVLLPEVRDMKGCTQNPFHHLDVWEHSLAVLEHAETIMDRPEDFFGPVADRVKDVLAASGRGPLLKLAALLHDVGKPLVRAVDSESGRITFYGHDGVGAQMAEAVSERLRMSGKERGILIRLVAEHMHVLDLSGPEVKRSTRMRWFRSMGDGVLPALILGMADRMAALGPDASEEARDAHLRWSREAAVEVLQRIRKGPERPPLVTGKDLLDLGLSQGPRVGEVLRAIQEAQDDGRVQGRGDALALAEELVGSDVGRHST